MISINIDKEIIEKFSEIISTDILTPYITNTLKDKKRIFLKCENDFYHEILLQPKKLIELHPEEIEKEFFALLKSHEEYVVYSSGSLPRIERHIQKSKNFKKYQNAWKKHKDSRKLSPKEKLDKTYGCKCNYCTVSKNAAQIFNWGSFTRKNNIRSIAWQYVIDLGLTVCPYCNRNYIAPISENEDDSYRPDLDHFFAKSTYPYFSLSLFNLVPSCSACNCRIKSDADFLNNGFFHPYYDKEQEPIFLLGGQLLDSTILDHHHIELRINNLINERTIKSLEFFRIKSAYDIHKREVCDFVNSLRIYPNKAIEERANSLNVAPDLLKLAMNRFVENDKTKYKHRPLGKLFRDIYLFTKEIK